VFWRMKSRPRGRPRIPADLRQLIVEMARNNPTWGEERNAAEVLLKLGIRVSPRTVRRYVLEDWRSRGTVSSQCWMTFVRNHAEAILARDFFIAVTAPFRVSCVFVIMEAGSPTTMSPLIPQRTGPSSSSAK
jgi:putative transposase